MFNFWWSAKQSEQKMLTKTQKNKKGPLSHPKKNVQFWIMFNFWWSAEWSQQKTLTEMQKKWKRPPKSLKNKMFIFGLHSTSDDQPSDPSIKHWAKCKKPKKAL